VLVQLASMVEIYVSSNICVTDPKEFSNKNHLKVANKIEPERELNQQQ
jgi:hypothetical protein